MIQNNNIVVLQHSTKMSAGIRAAGLKWCTDQSLNDIALKYFCVNAYIYVDV